MKYVDEYRDPARVKICLDLIRNRVKHPWVIMEICGGQTHSIVKYGLDELLPREIELIHGPGCPVCVTPVELIDAAIQLALKPGLILCSFGDMLRVPGSRKDLFWAKSEGADVRIVYSPLDALECARLNPSKEVVFFAVGFETTAPANALAVSRAQKERIRNFSILVSHVLVPPAMEAILQSSACRVQGFLAAGHVCTIMGTQAYEPIAERFRVPIVVTGFEPLDILEGINLCVSQLEAGRFKVENQYARSVRAQGNRSAQDLIQRVFRVTDRRWRGMGGIPQSGLGLANEYAAFDVLKRFGVDAVEPEESGLCESGLILQGLKKPKDCPSFGRTCKPEKPLGAPMVSSEGACAAYYRYRAQGWVKP